VTVLASDDGASSEVFNTDELEVLEERSAGENGGEFVEVDRER
jgi:hypothetical protein